mmetsp:Transcript_32376/g.49531  ORF Transcript_32376/g.49531 Transcript_32376/m.49531 type:complete len:87 (+) Transcript_32376:1082-1342(+)
MLFQKHLSPHVLVSFVKGPKDALHLMDVFDKDDNTAINKNTTVLYADETCSPFVSSPMLKHGTHRTRTNKCYFTISYGELPPPSNW